MIQARLRTRSGRGDGERDGMARIYEEEDEEKDGGAKPLWRKDRRYGWRLAALGVTQRRDIYGGEEAYIRGRGMLGVVGRTRTPTEIGEAFGKRGKLTGGRRKGGILTGGERQEYNELVAGMTEEETKWIIEKDGPTAEREKEWIGTEVEGAMETTRGTWEYLVERNEGGRRWETNPSNMTKEARRGMEKEKRRTEKEQRNGGWEFRDTMRRTKEKEEPGWLWLATEAPRARGERDAATMVTEARREGVRGAEERIGESRDRGKKEIRKMREEGETMERGMKEAKDKYEGENGTREENKEACRTAQRLAEQWEENVIGILAMEAVRDRGKEGPSEKWEAKVARREAEWIAVKARRAGGEMLGELTRWAQRQPGWRKGHRENSEGAGAAEDRIRNTPPTRWKGGDRMETYPGTKEKEPDENGRRRMLMTISEEGEGEEGEWTRKIDGKGCMAKLEEEKMWKENEEDEERRKKHTEEERKARAMAGRIRENRQRAIERRTERRDEEKREEWRRTLEDMRREQAQSQGGGQAGGSEGGERERKGVEKGEEKERNRMEGDPNRIQARAKAREGNTAVEVIRGGSKKGEDRTGRDEREREEGESEEEEEETEEREAPEETEETEEWEERMEEMMEDEEEIERGLRQEARQLEEEIERREAEETWNGDGDEEEDGEEEKGPERGGGKGEREAQAKVWEREARRTAMKTLRGEKWEEKREREEAKEAKKYEGVQYWERMGEGLQREIARRPGCRLCVRHEGMERETPERATGRGVGIGMERGERGKITIRGTKWVAMMIEALCEANGIEIAVAVDGSADEHGGVKVAAWGSWDGRRARGGALPGKVGNHVAELVAIERTLARMKEGDRIVILCDCQSAMRTVTDMWKEGEFGGIETSGDKRKGGGVAELICIHIARIAGGGGDARSTEEVEEGNNPTGEDPQGMETQTWGKETGGKVCIAWVKAHGGGVAPNAYADAIAKSHLAEEPEDVKLWELPRASTIMAEDEEGKEWAILADKPVRELVKERITEAILGEWEKEERKRGKVVVAERTIEGCDQRILRAMRAEKGAGTREEPTDTGISGRMRSDDVGMPWGAGTNNKGEREKEAGEAEED